MKDREKTSGSEGYKNIEYFAYGLVKILDHEHFSEMLKDWEKASMLLRLYTIENNTDKVFPLSLDEQLDFLTKPVRQWGIGKFEDLEDINQPLLIKQENEFIASDIAVDLANKYEKNPGAEDLEKIKRLVRNSMLDNNIYIKFRELLVRNPVILEEKFIEINKQLNDLVDENAEEIISYNLEAELTELFKNQYEEIHPNEIIEGKLNLCPYCGYLLSVKKLRNFEGKKREVYSCIYPKCLHRRRQAKRKIIKTKENIRYYKLKKPIVTSVVIPGIIEINLYDRLKKCKKQHFEIELYPGADKSDLLVRFNNGEEWAVDAKDWNNPKSLALDLNKKGFMTGIYNDENYNIDRGFLVLPDNVDRAYINTLKANWNEVNSYEIIKSGDFIRLVKLGGLNESSI